MVLTESLGVHRSFLATASLPTLGEVPVRIKALSGKRLANELVAALLGEEVGAKVPTCFAIEVESSHAHEHEWDGRAYCFASVLVPDSKDLSQSATLANPLAAEEFFSKEDWHSVVLLDTLVANSDRTSANILVDALGQLWAIDHETCFGGDWDVIDLQPLRHTTNLLARPGTAHPTKRQREDLLARVRERPSRIMAHALVSRLPDIGLLTLEDAEALSLYIGERWRSLDKLLELALFSRY